MTKEGKRIASEILKVLQWRKHRSF